MTAPDLSPAERAVVDRIEQAPDALGLREEVAEVLYGHWESSDPRTHEATCGCYWRSGEHFLADAEGAHEAWSEHVADMILPLIERREAEVLRRVSDRLDVWEFPPGSDALEPMYRLVRTLRAEADRIGGTR